MKKEVKQVADKIIEINKPSVHNKQIYFVITGKKRFSKKVWYELREILVKLIHKKYRGYLFYAWNPMMASRYNFPYFHNLEKEEWEIQKSGLKINWCAGFSLHKG